jgi:hypothetical protein
LAMPSCPMFFALAANTSYSRMPFSSSIIYSEMAFLKSAVGSVIFFPPGTCGYNGSLDIPTSFKIYADISAIYSLARGDREAVVLPVPHLEEAEVPASPKHGLLVRALHP